MSGQTYIWLCVIFVTAIISGFIGGWLATTPAIWWVGVAKWQTLITGVIAIGAALIGAAAVYYSTDRQIRENKSAESARKHASLSDIFPKLIRTTDVVIDYLNSVKDEDKFVKTKVAGCFITDKEIKIITNVVGRATGYYISAYKRNLNFLFYFGRDSEKSADFKRSIIKNAETINKWATNIQDGGLVDEISVKND
ncbi:hypothetical protein [Eilatimonas milleporae]|uniref:hypothetical protein n=1 Tax=Eilatimonas milleporae TaxID=911205 RepID=UPI0011C42024|nr:hypothetical protein [Eilatimonas milleporae]